jgi:hypothetical protein
LDLKLAQTDPHYLVLDFYQINRSSEIQTRDHFVIKTLISCQRTISTKKLKLINKISKYNLYYSLIHIICTAQLHIILCTAQLKGTLHWNYSEEGDGNWK